MSSRVVIPVLEGLEQNDKPLVKQVVKGIKQLQHQAINSQSHSTTQTTFNFQPPSQNTVIDRRFELEMDVRLESNLGANALNKVDAAQLSADGSAAGTPNAAAQTCGFRRTKFRAPLKQTFAPPTLTAVPASTVAGADTAAAVKVSVDAVIADINANLTTALNNQNGIAFGGSDVGDNATEVVYGNNLAPSQLPLASCMESIDLVINGTHFSVSVAQYIHAIMTYTSPQWREHNLPQCPHAPDMCEDFLSGSDRNGSGTNYNSLSLDGEGFRAGETPRGAYLRSTSTVANTAGQNGAGLLFNFREPLFISPLMAMLGHGLTNVNQLDITIRWSANAHRRMFKYVSAQLLRAGGRQIFASGAGDNTVYPDEATLSAVFTNTQARLNVLYYTPQDDVNIPNEIILPYKQPQIETVNAGQGAGRINNQNYTVNGNNVRLNQVPEAVYLYVATRHSSKRMDNPDNFARITGVNIKWKNQTGILSAYEEKDLIELARYNGYDGTVDEVMRGAEGIMGSAFSGGNPYGKGLVLKLNYGQDIPLDDNESAGTRGDYNWQCDVTFNSGNIGQVNGADANTDLVFYQIFILNGHIIISPNECRVSTGVLSLEDNMNASEMGHSYKPNDIPAVGGSVMGGSEVGGSLIGGATNHLKKIVDVGKKAVQMGKDLKPCVVGVADAVKTYQSRA